MDQLIREMIQRKNKVKEIIKENEYENQDSREVYFDRKKDVIRGVNKVAAAVGSTLGAKGRLVLYTEAGRIKATKDGATVAEHIFLSNKFENYGAALLLEAAKKTERESGDGTSTSSILTNFILTELQNTAENKNFYNIQKGMLKAASDINRQVELLKSDISLDLLYKVAFTSSNNNKEIANSIMNIYKQLTNWDIDVLFHKSDNLLDEVEVEYGYKISHGASKINKKEQKNNIKIVLLNYNVQALGENLGKTVIQTCRTAKTPVLFICRDYTQDFIDDIERQSRDYYIPMYAVKLDLYGREADNQMRDLEYATSSIIIEDVPAYPLPSDALGEAKTVIFNTDRTSILFEEPIDEYIESVEEELVDVNDPIAVININRRLEKLKSVTANYIVGGATPQEMEERYDRIEDAVLACRSAIRHGVIKGGGVTYLQIYNILNKNKSKTDFDLGYNTVIKSLTHLFNMLCENSYRDDAIEIYSKIEESEFKSIFNFATEKYETGEEISIYDTATTAQVAIEAAVSVASTIILTSAIII